LSNESEPINLEHQALKWVATWQMVEYPMGKIDRRIAMSLAADWNT
jgi:hypothetical protein